MTNQEWKRRCAERILAAVKKAGRISLRDLERATHYNRGPGERGVLWWEAFEALDKQKRIAVEYGGEFGMHPAFVRTPETAPLIAPTLPALPAKRRSMWDNL